MKSIPLLALISVAQACGIGGGRGVQGFPAPARVCGAVAGGALSGGYCLSGAISGVKDAIQFCRSQDGTSLDTTACVIAYAEAAFFGLAGTVAVGTAILYAAGYQFGAGLVVRAAHDQLAGGGEVKRDLVARSAMPILDKWAEELAPIDQLAFSPSVNTSLPMLTWADVNKNLAYPFQLKLPSGRIGTYFPDAYPEDPDMLYTYYLPSYNATANTSSVVERDVLWKPRGVQVESHDSSWPLVKREECGGTSYSLPYLNFPKVSCRSEDWLDIVNAAVPDYVNSGKAVLEIGVHNNQGYTYQNSRFVVETRAFDECYEGQYAPGSNVACCAN